MICVLHFKIYIKIYSKTLINNQERKEIYLDNLQRKNTLNTDSVQVNKRNLNREIILKAPIYIMEHHTIFFSLFSY